MFSKLFSFIFSGFFALFSFFIPWKGMKESLYPTAKTIKAEETFLKDNSIHIVVKAYTAEESKKFLHNNLLKKGYQPVQITIQNNSAEEFSLSNGSVDLPTASSSKVARKMIESALPRSIAYKIIGIFFWPAVIPSTIDSIITLNTYAKIKNDLQSKIVKKEVIAPYSIFNRIVFVPKDSFQDSFDITLIDLDTLEPKVVHVSGLEMGKTVEAFSDVNVDKKVKQEIIEQDTQSVLDEQ